VKAPGFCCAPRGVLRSAVTSLFLQRPSTYTLPVVLKNKEELRDRLVNSNQARSGNRHTLVGSHPVVSHLTSSNRCQHVTLSEFTPCTHSQAVPNRVGGEEAVSWRPSRASSGGVRCCGAAGCRTGVATGRWAKRSKVKGGAWPGTSLQPERSCSPKGTSTRQRGGHAQQARYKALAACRS
jgi:hypothetical protein